jgi:hypothetical protein
MAHWRASAAHALLERFLARLAEAAVGHATQLDAGAGGSGATSNAGSSAETFDGIAWVLGLLAELARWTDEIAPLQSPQRFGNLAFRTWGARCEEVRAAEAPQLALSAALTPLLLTASRGAACPAASGASAVHPRAGELPARRIWLVGAPRLWLGPRAGAARLALHAGSPRRLWPRRAGRAANRRERHGRAAGVGACVGYASGAGIPGTGVGPARPLWPRARRQPRRLGSGEWLCFALPQRGAHRGLQDDYHFIPYVIGAAQLRSELFSISAPSPVADDAPQTRTATFRHSSRPSRLRPTARRALCCKSAPLRPLPTSSPAPCCVSTL